MDSPNLQRMFHGGISAAALADQLVARFHERHYRTSITHGPDTALAQIGSQHGTPVSVHIANIVGGVMVTMSHERDWLDQVSDSSELLERASRGGFFSLLAMIPEALGEMKKENLAPLIWNVINEICALTRTLAGEPQAPPNPKLCPYCQTVNPYENEICLGCGGPLPLELPRECPKCGRLHTSDALFCQACGTRLVEG